MKYGIIGTGWIAKAFIDGVRLCCDSQIKAVYSRTAEKGNAFAAECGIPEVYTDLDSFSKADIDAVYIASPNVLHAPHSKKMLESGKHVICEKPLAVTPGEIEECVSLAKEKGLIYLEAIMYMHTPDRDTLREAIVSIGKITSAHFDFSQLSSKYPAYLRGEMPNIFNPALATGCLMDLGVYCVYPAVDLFGMPDSVASSAVFLRTGSDGSGNASLIYGDNLVTLTYSKTGQDYNGSCIFGDGGTIVIESISKMINGVIYDPDGNKKELLPYREKAELMGFEAMEFEEFIENPQNEKYALCTRMSLDVSRVMQKIRDAAGIRFTSEVNNA